MKNKGLEQFIKQSIKSESFVQRGNIHGKNIKQILDESRSFGSVHLTGTREERKAQLKSLRSSSIKNDKNRT